MEVIKKIDVFKNFNSKSFIDYLKNTTPPIGELIWTEEVYVNKLSIVVDCYINEFTDDESEIVVPKALRDYDHYMIFGNIEEIYYWHKNYFLVKLRERQHSLLELSNIFIENKEQFHMYAIYNNNNVKSEYIIGSHRNYFYQIGKKFNLDLTIENLMMEPIKRMFRYILLLENIVKFTSKKGTEEEKLKIREALDVMMRVKHEANEFIELGGIQNFDGLISEQGNLLLRGTLKCKYNKKQKKYLHVFVFKRIILFTKEKKHKNNYFLPTFECRLQIPMNMLIFKELPHYKFSLQLLRSNLENHIVICEAASYEDHKKWTRTIKQEINIQTNLVNDLVHPDTDEDEPI